MRPDPRGAEQRFARDWALRLQLGTAPLTIPAWTLSGGNQQKVVLAKWLATEPKLLILDEPTRGIDVGTKAEVHRLMSELAREGVAVLMISTELPEVLGMADRVVVLFEGRLAREFMRAEADEDAIMRAATGLSRRRHDDVAEEPRPPPSSERRLARGRRALLRFRELGIVSRSRS